MGRSRIRRAPQDNELSRTQSTANLFYSLGHMRHIGVLAPGKRSRNTDMNDIQAHERLEIGRGAKSPGGSHRRDGRSLHILDIGSVGFDRLDLLAVDIDPGYLETGSREFKRQGQTDVPQADDAHRRLPGLDSKLEFVEATHEAPFLKSGRSFPVEPKKSAKYRYPETRVRRVATERSTKPISWPGSPAWG